MFWGEFNAACPDAELKEVLFLSVQTERMLTSVILDWPVSTENCAAFLDDFECCCPIAGIVCWNEQEKRALEGEEGS